mmetsp:Transcript_37950/g.74318  ORF Transcript_37950/g.74318 Transcript_37950/m.74318 type:complete len:234 (-) Transcript_37950:1214-1915(-)
MGMMRLFRRGTTPAARSKRTSISGTRTRLMGLRHFKSNPRLTCGAGLEVGQAEAGGALRELIMVPTTERKPPKWGGTHLRQRLRPAVATPTNFWILMLRHRPRANPDRPAPGGEAPIRALISERRRTTARTHTPNRNHWRQAFSNTRTIRIAPLCPSLNSRIGWSATQEKQSRTSSPVHRTSHRRNTAERRWRKRADVRTRHRGGMVEMHISPTCITITATDLDETWLGIPFL